MSPIETKFSRFRCLTNNRNVIQFFLAKIVHQLLAIIFVPLIY